MQQDSNNQTAVIDGTRQQKDQLLYDEEIDKLIEWLRCTPHLPNVTGKLHCLN